MSSVPTVTVITSQGAADVSTRRDEVSSSRDAWESGESLSGVTVTSHELVSGDHVTDRLIGDQNPGRTRLHMCKDEESVDQLTCQSFRRDAARVSAPSP